MHISGGEADSVTTSHKATAVRVCRTFPAAVFSNFLRKSDHLQPWLRWPKMVVFQGKFISSHLGGDQNLMFFTEVMLSPDVLAATKTAFFCFLWRPKQVFYAKPWCLPNPMHQPRKKKRTVLWKERNWKLNLNKPNQISGLDTSTCTARNILGEWQKRLSKLHPTVIH